MTAKKMTSKCLTEAEFDELAAPYEGDSVEVTTNGQVMAGSHLEAVGKRRVTVVYEASDTQRVADIARKRGITPSEVYREALTEYFVVHL